MQLLTHLMNGAPSFLGLLVLILAGLTGIVLLRALFRIVQLGPVEWVRDSLRIDEGFWMPLAVIIWVIVGALMALAWPSGLNGLWPWG